MASRMMTGAAVAVLLSGFLAQYAAAYETPTHSLISQQAIDRSVLRIDPTLLEDFGLTGGLDQPSFPGLIPTNEVTPMPDSAVLVEKATIRQLIKSGAVLEDRAINSLHHFYDPIHGGRGLTLGRGQRKISAGLASPDWMLETDSSISKLLGQRFSYPDSMKYFYRALTANQLAERDTNWGLMFRGLGHLIHHIQDMAQPQHVRNDQHCDGMASRLCFSLNNPSHFEKYTDLHRDRILALAGSYPVPEFPRMRQFWNNATGTGLANFVQSNFVSQGTNFQYNAFHHLVTNPDYPLPVPRIEPDSVPETIASAIEHSPVSPEEGRQILQGLDCDIAQECMINFISSTVMDSAPGQEIRINQRASSISLFDDELRGKDSSVSPAITYNRLNFHAAYPYLISRAIAYSTGMINHFFRGQLSVSSSLNNGDVTEITVSNRSGQNIDLSQGRFELYYDSLKGGRKSIKQISVKSGGLPLAPGNSLTITMTLPADVNTSLERPYLLVFNALDGRLGFEAGIAAVAFDVSVVGEVEYVSKNAGLCPENVYGISITFPQQPPNKGKVVLQGESSRATFNFASLASGVEYFFGTALWLHKLDSDMNVYRYVVTHRYAGSTADPCSIRGLDRWIPGERVKALLR